MRLIDADALPEYTGYALSANEVAKAVENAPTIDAEPVRRGKWIENRGDIICSQCGIEIPEEITWLRGINAEGPFFCPNCGAKMEV